MKAVVGSLAVIVGISVAFVLHADAGDHDHHNHGDHKAHHHTGHDAHHAHHGHHHNPNEVDLSPFMIRLQRYGEKLGYAIQGRNTELSDYYFSKVVAVLEDVKSKADTHHGLPVPETVIKIMDPLVKDFRLKRSTKEWTNIDSGYNALLDGCNRCHSTFEHEFLAVKPPDGKPVYSQEF